MAELCMNKNILVMGVRNKWSIAWGIAQTLLDQGANVILTYLGEREKESLEKLTEKNKSISIISCDVTSNADIQNLFSVLKKQYGVLHGLVHAIAHAKTEELQGAFLNTSREGFLHAMNVSTYSLIAVTRNAKDLMNQGGSIITLSYYGSEKVMPGYNVMGVAKAALEASVRYLAFDLGPSGIRINAISAGPIMTMSAKGIQNFSEILDTVRVRAPLRRNVTLNDLGKSAVCLLSDLSDGITGQVIYVDSGYCIMGI